VVANRLSSVGAVYDRAYLSIREKRALIERAFYASILVFCSPSVLLNRTTAVGRGNDLTPLRG
jgi:hypothetical protein